MVLGLFWDPNFPQTRPPNHFPGQNSNENCHLNNDTTSNRRGPGDDGLGGKPTNSNHINNRGIKKSRVGFESDPTVNNRGIKNNFWSNTVVLISTRTFCNNDNDVKIFVIRIGHFQENEKNRPKK